MKNAVIFFDGCCVLCNRFLSFASKRDTDNSLVFSPLDSELAKSLLKDPTKLDSVLVFNNGNILDKSDAVIFILKKLQQPWPSLGGVLKIVPRVLRDAGYKIVANLRYRVFGRYNSCPLEPGRNDKRVIFTIDEYGAYRIKRDKIN